MAEFGSGSSVWDAVADKPELPEGVSLNEYRTWQNQIISAIAENQFEVGLTELGYPDGFFDVFVDESKIASKTGVSVTTGTNKQVKLTFLTSKAERVGDTEGASDSTAAGLEIKPNEDVHELEVEVSSFTDGINEIGITDSNSNKLDFKTGSYTGGDKVTLNANLNSGVNYYVYAYNGGNNYTKGATSDIDSSLNYPYTSEYVDITGAAFSILSGSPDYVDYEAYNIKSVTAVSGYPSSGSFTSTVQSLGYQATEVTLTADYSLNGQDISAELRTGSGSTITTISESEIGDTISISTTATDYDIVWSFSGDGSDTPVLNDYEVGLDDK